MIGLKFKKVDAFTQGGSSGNPAGLVYLSDPSQITAEQMQAIARDEKSKVSEVVFCAPIKKDYYVLKYFSSECEVEFCGHATIACMYDLIKNNPALADIDTLTISTVKGELLVINALAESDAVFITAPAPEYIGCNVSIQNIADNLGISLDGIDMQFAIEIINAGLNTLLVPIQKFDTIMDIKPDCLKLRDFCIDNQIDIILVFCPKVFAKVNAYRTRVFAPKYGYLEDPATGSGNAALAYYLLKHGLWDGTQIISLEQGPSRDIPNIVKLGTLLYAGGQQVIFGGQANLQYEKEI